MVTIQAIPFYTVMCWYHKKNDPLKYRIAQIHLGQKLSLLLQFSGPTFIKLGQALSTRPDLIGEVLASSLATLQDKLPPFPFSIVKRQIELHFGNTVENTFDEFCPIPVAAASIAQVHKAKLKTGEYVAVKILRPNIEKQFSSDIEFFKLLIRLAQYCFGKSISRLNLEGVLQMLIDCIRFELDLRYEAAAADEISFNTKNDAFIRIPKVYWQLISKHVLTIEWIDGTPITDCYTLLLQGHDLHKIAQNLTVTFFNQAFRDGFFHADLHPGNILIDEKGNIVLIDFGIIGQLNRDDRIYVAEILYGFINRDYQRVADIHFKAGYVPDGKDIKLFTLACRAIGEPIIGLPANKISAAQLLKQLFEVTSQFEMPTQTQLLLLQKTMITIEGIGQIIYPEVNMWQLADPWIKEWAHSNFSIKAKVKNTVNNISELAQDLPKFCHEVRRVVQLTNAINLNKLRAPSLKRHKSHRYYAVAFLGGMITIAVLKLLM